MDWDGRRINVEDLAQCDLLEEIPESVRYVGLSRVDIRELPPLPAHVTNLSLYGVTITRPAVLHEGLKYLNLVDVQNETSYLKWSFPSTLLSLTVRHNELNDEDSAGDIKIDLRGVTSTEIKLSSIYDHVDIRLPEGLEELAIDQCVFRDSFELPPHLRKLSVWNIEDAQFLRGTNPQVTDLTIGRIEEAFDISYSFPSLKCLRFDGYRSPSMGKLRLPDLEDLFIVGHVPTDNFRVDCPKLEKLFIEVSHEGPSPYDSPDSTLGDTVKELSLTCVESFPTIANEWERLEYLSTTESIVEIPYIRWLTELVLDEAQVTNGAFVWDIDDYKKAWGFTARRKPARRP